MISCARTEDGIINMLPLFKTYKTSTTSKSKHINKIFELESDVNKMTTKINALNINEFEKAR